MYTRQVSVFLENRQGRIAEITKLLSEAEINIRTLSLADMTDLGVLRLIVNDTERCVRVLKANGVAAQVTAVVAVEVEDKPGGLHRILTLLTAHGLNIEYMYAFVGRKSNNAIVVFKVDPVEKAVQVLNENGIPVLSEKDAENI